MMKKAIPITYKIFMTEEISHDYVEYFVPYSGKELQKSPFLSEIGKDYAILFAENGKNDFDFLPHNEVADEEILPNTANILMDAIYCINAAFSDSLLLKPYDSMENAIKLLSYYIQKKKFFGNKIGKKSDVARFWFLNNSFFLVYVGLYTELIKIEIAEIKYAISALIRLYNSSENIDKELADSFLKKIKEIYLLDVDGFSVTNKNSIKEGILYFFKQIDYFKCNQKGFCAEIDLRRFDRFVNLIRKYNENSDKKDNLIEGQKCFCLAQEGKDFFFSFSGYNVKQFKKLGNKIKCNLETYFKGRTFTFCELDDNVLSYGYVDRNKKFRAYPIPIKYKDAVNGAISKTRLPSQYACCERKIFPHTTNRDQPLYVFCKYEPCCKCIPAVEKQKTRRSEFLFLALAKDFHELSRILKKGKIYF